MKLQYIIELDVVKNKLITQNKIKKLIEEHLDDFGYGSLWSSKNSPLIRKYPKIKIIQQERKKKK